MCGSRVGGVVRTGGGGVWAIAEAVPVNRLINNVMLRIRSMELLLGADGLIEDIELFNLLLFNYFLKVADFVARPRCPRRRGNSAALIIGAFGMALKRTADKIARTQSNGERERKENDALPKRIPKASSTTLTADLQMIEDHGRSENKHEAISLQARGTVRILQLSIDGPDQHSLRARKRAMRLPATRSRIAPTA